MLVIEHRFAYVTVDTNRNVLVESVLLPDQRQLAAEWAAEVARDVASEFGGNPATVYKLITENL